MKNIIKLSFSILIILLVTIFQFCRKEEIKKTIKITTDEVISTSIKSATVKGTIVDIGEGVNEYGHVWSTSQEIENVGGGIIKYEERMNPGVYKSEFTDLTPNTTYYVWAYASDGKIAVTGKMLTFTTEAQTLAIVITGTAP